MKRKIKQGLAGVEYIRKQMTPEESQEFDEEFKEIRNRRLGFLDNYKGGNQKWKSTKF